MSTVHTYVRARIDTDTKERAADVLNAMGLTISDAIRIMLIRIVQEQALPFGPLAPNAKTIATMMEARAGGLESFASEKDLMADLNGED